MLKHIRILLASSVLALNISAAFAAGAPASFKVGEFTFQRAEKWTWVESASAMRKAQLKVATSDGKQVTEVVFFHFGPGSGGGTSANVERWLGQFQEGRDKIDAKVQEVAVGGRKLTYVHAHGTYMGGMPGGPKTAQADTILKGAILESDEGSVFVKLTGPSSQVKGLENDFKTLVESALKK